MKRKKGYFSISAVAKMFSVHQQTIRLYEKEGLIVPKRSEGNTRLFSEEDVDKLEEIIYLTHQLGINLAGVEMILKLQKKIKRLQGDMNKVFDEAHEDLEKEVVQGKVEAQSSARKLITLKHEKLKEFEINNKNSQNVANNQDDVIDLVQWEVDYDE
jgi:MerR family transcriptional regulator, heat shock protein HspR